VGRRSADPILAVAPAWGKYRSNYLVDLTSGITWQLSSYLFPGQPAWYRVGLATYMGTLGFEDDGGRRYVGSLPWNIVGPPWEVPDTLAITLSGGSPMYGELGLRSPGWMLVRWLSESRPTEYLVFLKQISSGVEGTAAWTAAFPQWDPARPEQMAQLEAELKAWLATGKLRYREVNATVAPTWTTRALATPEVHTLRIRIRQDSMALRAIKDSELRWSEATALDQAAALKSRLVAESAAEAAEALAEVPLHPAALRLAAGEKAVDPVKARAATEAYPKDWRPWLLLGDSLRGGDAVEARHAYRKAVELGKGEPVAHLGVAAGYLAMGEEAAALPEAREAARLAPYSDEALAVLAASAARSGACPEALVAAKRLRGRLPAGQDARADGLLDQVASLCPAAGPTAMR
jgi:Flp pilus assembly protein TadD